jgi:hypothetical protein
MIWGATVQSFQHSRHKMASRQWRMYYSDISKSLANCPAATKRIHDTLKEGHMHSFLQQMRNAHSAGDQHASTRSGCTTLDEDMHGEPAQLRFIDAEDLEQASGGAVGYSLAGFLEKEALHLATKSQQEVPSLATAAAGAQRAAHAHPVSCPLRCVVRPYV